MGNLFLCVTRLIFMCDVTHFFVWRDSFPCETGLIFTCDMTHWYRRRRQQQWSHLWSARRMAQLSRPSALLPSPRSLLTCPCLFWLISFDYCRPLLTDIGLFFGAAVTLPLLRSLLTCLGLFWYVSFDLCRSLLTYWGSVVAFLCSLPHVSFGVYRTLYVHV